MKLLSLPKYALILLTTLAFIQCNNDDDTPELINEEEEINRIEIKVTGDSGPEIYTWNEGDNGLDLPLAASGTYQVEVSFFDASDPNDVEAINPEVIEEADEHHVLFENSSAVLAIANASNDNQDSSGNPLGLKTTWTTSDAGSAVVRLFLIHEPTTKSGQSRDDFGGETDVQLDINVTVQ